MAHFAELDENNIVLRVIVVDNSDLLDADGVEQEALGVAFCQSLFGGAWKQTSYNRNFRKNYAGVGYTYDPSRDAFIPPAPAFASWVLNEATCCWEAPIPYPQDENRYVWSEELLSWSLADGQ